MWERSSLKRKGKARFLANYWKCVLAALVLIIALGGGGGSSSGGSASSDLGESMKELSETIKGNSTGSIDATGLQEDLDSMSDELSTLKDNILQDSSAKTTVLAIVVFAIVIVLFAVAIGILISAFLFNPLQMGCRKFFLKNLDEAAELKEIGAGFDKGYMNVVKTMFLVDLSCFLWGLLFIIPGIIKKYEYRMVVYLLAQNPHMDAKEAKEKSSQMMSGNKWAAFVLDLSFLGWYILSVLTCGILSIFYVNPYVYQTEAALFETLNGGTGMEVMQQMQASNYSTYEEF